MTQNSNTFTVQKGIVVIVLQAAAKRERIQNLSNVAKSFFTDKMAEKWRKVGVHKNKCIV